MKNFKKRNSKKRGMQPKPTHTYTVSRGGIQL